MPKDTKLKLREKDRTMEVAAAVDDWVNEREVTKRFTVDLPISLHKKLKLAAVKRDTTMQEIIIRMLKDINE